MTDINALRQKYAEEPLTALPAVPGYIGFISEKTEKLKNLLTNNKKRPIM